MCVFALLCLILMSCAPSKEEAELSLDPGTLISLEIVSDDKHERINLWMQDTSHAFVFLPSYAKMEDISLNLHTSEAVSIDGQAVTQGMNCGGLLSDHEYALKIGNHTKLQLCFVRSAGVPAIFINTESGEMEAVNADKKHKENASIVIYNDIGEVVYQTKEKDRIRGRGNWTWEQEKKPYNLYFDKTVNLFRLGESDRWVLLANALDETNLRNWLVYQMAGRMDMYEGFAPDCEFADLYLNGNYNGLYLLSEKVDPGENGLVIGEEDFLFALDSEERMSDMETAFLMNPGIAVEIKSPDPCDEKRLELLKSHLTEMQEAFLSENSDRAKTWSDYIDLNSWVGKYLVEEVFLNFDAGAQSQYFFWNREEDKIYAGPCWDYDNILGVFGYGMTPDCFLAQRIWKNKQQYTPWYGTLCEKEVFDVAVRETYKRSFLPALQAIMDNDLPEETARIKAAAQADRLRWPDLCKNKDSFQEAVSQMTDFMNRRIDFLNSAWIDGTEYCTITLKTKYGEYRFFCVTPGSVCKELPSPEDFGLSGVKQWSYEDSGEVFDYDTVITEDIVLYAAS